MPKLDLFAIKSADGTLLRLVKAPGGRMLEAWDGRRWLPPSQSAGLSPADWVWSPEATADELRAARLMY